MTDHNLNTPASPATMPTSASRLFQPTKLGAMQLSHRIGMPTMTRLRNDENHVATPLQAEYYRQRAFASGPGTLMFVGAVMGDEKTSSTGVGAVVPKAMTLEEIQQTVRDYAQAARNAMRAGFDGVEIMAGYGYLLDSFLQDVTNEREDAYGGSVENRSRLLQEIMKAVVEAAGGPERVGVRLSPWSTFQGMGMADPVPQFSDVVLKAKSLNLGFIHLIEARVSGFDDVAQEKQGQNMEFAYNLWRDGTFLAAGGYTPESARRLVDEKYPNLNIIVMFGRHFTPNPDLVFRIKHGLALTSYRRGGFYYAGSPQNHKKDTLLSPLAKSSWLSMTEHSWRRGRFPRKKCRSRRVRRRHFARSGGE